MILSQHAGNSTTRSVRYGRGYGVSLLDQTVCHGNETSLLSCAHAQVGSRECTYPQDASATCIGESLHRDLSISTPPSYHSSLPNQDVLSLLIKQHWALQKNIHMQTHTHTYKHTHTHMHTYTHTHSYSHTYAHTTHKHSHTYAHTAHYISSFLPRAVQKNESTSFQQLTTLQLARKGTSA